MRSGRAISVASGDSPAIRAIFNSRRAGSWRVRRCLPGARSTAKAQGGAQGAEGRCIVRDRELEAFPARGARGVAAGSPEFDPNARSRRDRAGGLYRLGIRRRTEPGAMVEAQSRRGLACGGERRLILALAHAIEHAHQRGILHRDLKPGNVLLHAPECDGAIPSQHDWKAVHAAIVDAPDLRLRHGQTARARSRRKPIASRRGSPPYMAPGAGGSATWARLDRPPTSTAWGRFSTRS